jgi:predicted dehydrogenase
VADQLRVGIAGYGVVGKRRRQYIDLNPHFKTVAVCDRIFEGSGQLDDGVLFFKTYQELLKADIDVLFVCMTNDIAAEATAAGLKWGCHVFCEKPPGRDLNDILNVIKAESEHPEQKLKYGFNHRYHDSVRDALALVRSGEFGKILNLRGVYGKSKILSFRSDWRTKREIAGGGILLDQGIHMVDLLRLFAGEFDQIHSIVSNDFWKHDVEDNAYALMRTKAGAVALLHSSATQWRHRFHLEIAMSRGTIILSGILSGTKSYGDETLTVVYSNDEGAGNPLEKMTRYNRDTSWEDEINEFAACIVKNLPVKNGNSLEAYRTMELVYRIYCADPVWKEKFNLELPEADLVLKRREQVFENLALNLKPLLSSEA